MRTREKERGAAAVEFALVFPLVIMLLLTVIEFSRLWNIQATISDAARVSARYAAIHARDDGFTVQDAKDQATAIPGMFLWSSATIEVTVACDDDGGKATSTISVSPGSMSEWFSTALGDPMELQAEGEMPCGG
ncbi:Flp pilus assembly protein TadG [Agromyces cerinus]|uniref:TadE/TadG family type IV pilus assembly protein n=1 Tax=Agromyces cerinus TaxID=33878 RepID=UPI001956FD9C|nr:TadE/TadG family type IV pilus assembly protein [Agromyces cerinus]MBM7831991.1 Flp pilus assembly protein TadG [Agromyces cerinus]